MSRHCPSDCTGGCAWCMSEARRVLHVAAGDFGLCPEGDSNEAAFTDALESAAIAFALAAAKGLEVKR